MLSASSKYDHKRNWSPANNRRAVVSSSSSPDGAPVVPGAVVNVRNTFIEAFAEGELQILEKAYSLKQYSHRRIRSCPNQSVFIDLDESEESYELELKHDSGTDDISTATDGFSGVLKWGIESDAEDEEACHCSPGSLQVSSMQGEPKLETMLCHRRSEYDRETPSMSLSLLRDRGAVVKAALEEAAVGCFARPVRTRRHQGGRAKVRQTFPDAHQRIPAVTATSSISITRVEGAPPARFLKTTFAFDGNANPAAKDAPAASARDTDKTILGLSNACHQRCRRWKAPRMWCHIYMDDAMIEQNDFDLIPKLIGLRGKNTKDIWESTGTKVRVRGRGSGHKESATGREANAHLMVAIAADHGRPDDFRNAVGSVKSLLEGITHRFEKYCFQRNLSTRRSSRFWMGEIPAESEGYLNGLKFPPAPPYSFHYDTHQRQMLKPR